MEGLFAFAPWTYGLATILVGAAVFATNTVVKGSKANKAVKGWLKTLKSMSVNTDKIDSSVASLLTKFGVPEIFGNFVGEVIESSAETILALKTEDEKVVRAVVMASEAFAALPSVEQNRLLTNVEVPKDFSAAAYVAGRVITEGIGLKAVSQMINKKSVGGK